MEAIRILETFDNVIIPYAPVIAENFPHDKPRTMRDFKKLLQVIQAVALLFQRKRSVIEKYGHKYLVSHPVDFLIALKILEDSLADTLFALYLAELEPPVDEYDSKKPYKYSISETRLMTLPNLSNIAIELIKPKSQEFLKRKFLPRKSGDYNPYLLDVSEEEVEEVLNACYNITNNEKGVSYLSDLLGNLRKVFPDLKIDLNELLNSEPCFGNLGNLSEETEVEEEKSNIEANNKNPVIGEHEAWKWNEGGENKSDGYITIKILKMPPVCEFVGIDGKIYEIKEKSRF